MHVMRADSETLSVADTFRPVCCSHWAEATGCSFCNVLDHCPGKRKGTGKCSWLTEHSRLCCWNKWHHRNSCVDRLAHTHWHTLAKIKSIMDKSSKWKRTCGKDWFRCVQVEFRWEILFKQHSVLDCIALNHTCFCSPLICSATYMFRLLPPYHLAYLQLSKGDRLFLLELEPFQQ